MGADGGDGGILAKGGHHGLVEIVTHCTTCGRPTCHARRSRCPACYRRVTRGHALAGPCAVCGLTDLRVLRRHALRNGVAVLCANHSAMAGRRSLTLTELRGECCPLGDRRDGEERRRAARREPEPDPRRTLLRSPDRRVIPRGQTF